uniref:Integrase catalytic domain-containing protein n=1 Tax=Fundulus heteroclitus TaxID=8078 RepID=A0A3Q2QNE0_FUNHE
MRAQQSLNSLSDRGPQFISQVWRHFCSALGARYTLTSGYHPQTNGQTERMNQQLETTLRWLTSSSPSDWNKFLPWVEYALNSNITSATGRSPFEVALGYQPPLLPMDELRIPFTSVNDYIARCQDIWRTTVTALTHTAEGSKRFADQHRRPAPHYRPGQKVWLSSRDVLTNPSAKKLAPRFTGPYEIVTVINPTTVRLSLPPHSRVHPTFHVSQIKPVLDSNLCPPSGPPPPSQDSQNPRVLRVVDARRRGRGHQYLVDWEGRSSEERS